MRHVGTLIAGVVIAPLAWILLAFGQDRSAAAFAKAQTADAFHSGDFVRPLQYLVVAGLLLGLIATLRFSPLGALVAGLGYVTCYALLLVMPGGLMSLLDHRLTIFGRHADLATPIRTGTALVLGALLLVSAISVGRWRRWPRPEEDEPALDRDRPVGVDGLGLFEPSRSLKPELSARYSTLPEPAVAGGGRARRSGFATDEPEPSW
jgi:hypothetical protein